MLINNVIRNDIDNDVSNSVNNNIRIGNVNNQILSLVDVPLSGSSSVDNISNITSNVIPLKTQQPNDNISYVVEFINSYKSKNTKRDYTSIVKEFFNGSIVPIWQMRNVTKIDVQTYIKNMVSKKLSSNTIKKKISCLCSFYDYVIDISDDCYLKNPFRGKFVKQLLRNNLTKKTKQDKKWIFNDDEIDLMYELARKDNFRNYLLVKVLFNLGLRREEVVTLKWNRFYQVEEEWFVNILGKGRKERELYVNDELIELLKRYSWGINKELGISDNKIFNISHSMVGKIIKKYIREGELDDNLSCHKIRHTNITHLINQGVDRDSVKQWAGHVSGRTTDMYFHFVNQRKNNAGRFVNL